MHTNSSGNAQPSPGSLTGGDQGLVAPRDRIRYMSDQRALAGQSPLGVAHGKGLDGENVVVFSSPCSAEVVTLPTRISREEFDAVVADVLPLKETRYILYLLASAQKEEWPILLEGGTAIGKTYAVNIFCRLLDGPERGMVDFYCNGQTDVSELMGKFVPSDLKPEQLKAIDRLLESDAGAALRAALMSECGGSLDGDALMQRAALKLGIDTSSKGFRWQDGSLIRAMRDGQRVHLQELGMAAVAITNALLKFRGTNGRLARSVQVSENAGETVHAAPGFQLILSTNPPGKEYLERHAVDPALLRACHYVRLPDRLSDESVLEATEQLFSPKRIPTASDSTIIDLSRHEELASTVGSLVGRLFLQYREKLAVSEPGRRQKNTATVDHLSRIAALVQRRQIASPDEKSVDTIETARQAVYGCLVAQLEDKESPFGASKTVEGAAKETKSLGKAIMDSFNNLLNGEVYAYSFRGKPSSLREAISTLEREAIESYEQTHENAKSREVAERARTTHFIRRMLDTLGVIQKDCSAAQFERLREAALRAMPKDDAELLKREVDTLQNGEQPAPQ
jgi:MoxR-like ATPase